MQMANWNIMQKEIKTACIEFDILKPQIALQMIVQKILALEMKKLITTQHKKEFEYLRLQQLYFISLSIYSLHCDLHLKFKKWTN